MRFIVPFLLLILFSSNYLIAQEGSKIDLKNVNKKPTNRMTSRKLPYDFEGDADKLFYLSKSSGRIRMVANFRGLNSNVARVG